MITLIKPFRLNLDNKARKIGEEADHGGYLYLLAISTKNRTKLLQIKEFLCQHQLTVDDDVEHFVVAYGTNQIIACGGISGHVLKSIAVSPALQGTGLRSN